MTLQEFQIKTENTLEEWRTKELTALKLLKIVGDLRFNKCIDLVLFRYDLYDLSPSRIIQLHDLAKDYSSHALPIQTTMEIASRISKLKALPACKLDIGKLGLEWQTDRSNLTSLSSFIENKLNNILHESPKNKENKDVVLYGFGRIGRIVARRIVKETGRGDQLRLKAIVIRPKMKDRYTEAEKRAALFLSDSIHGDFTGTVDVAKDGSEITINGNRVRLIYAGAPEELDYTTYGIHDALLIDNTGVWRSKDELSRHLRPGISAVMLTAPGKGDVPNIVYGANQNEFDFDKVLVMSAASCTTNAIVPVLKVINDRYGVMNGHLETIHAYTNDQNLLDNFHKKERRGRGAPVNMVLTSTGAATAVAKVLPELAGKLSGNAIRVPLPNVSLAILKLNLKDRTTKEELNQILKQASLSGELVEQIRYSASTEYVSSNAIGMTGTSVVDAPSTIVSPDGMNIIVYLWYDNEYGYSCQVIRLAKHVAQVRRYVYY